MDGKETTSAIDVVWLRIGMEAIGSWIVLGILGLDTGTANHPKAKEYQAMMITGVAIDSDNESGSESEESEEYSNHSDSKEECHDDSDSEKESEREYFMESEEEDQQIE